MCVHLYFIDQYSTIQFLILHIVFAEGCLECHDWIEWYVRLWFVNDLILNTLATPHVLQDPMTITIICVHSPAIGIRPPPGKYKQPDNLCPFLSSSLYNIPSQIAFGEIGCYIYLNHIIRSSTSTNSCSSRVSTLHIYV